MIPPFFTFLLCCLCLTIDQWSKAWAVANLTTGGIFLWEGLGGLRLSLDLVTNTGTAWGFFATAGPLLIGLRIVIVTGCFLYTAFVLRGKREQCAMAFVSTGALSNIVDYFLYGHVIDLFHVVLWGYDYPVFNIADSMICIGVVYWLLLQYMSTSKVVETQ